jgi:hypothetical protein
MNLIDGLIAGARNMIGIGIATATAGIIVGTVTLTGVGAVMADLVEVMSGGNILLMLILHRPDQPDPRHGPADHGQLHRRLGADGAGDRHAGRSRTG